MMQEMQERTDAEGRSPQEIQVMAEVLKAVIMAEMMEMVQTTTNRAKVLVLAVVSQMGEWVI